MSASNRQQSVGVREEAVAWFVRRDSDLLSADDELRFQMWVARPGNAAAYARVSKLWDAAGEATIVPREAEPASDAPAAAEPEFVSVRAKEIISAPPQVLVTSSSAFAPQTLMSRYRRRRALRLAGAVAACLLVALLSPQLILRMRADAVSAVGEIKAVPLPDGSRLTLNTGSAVAFDFSNEHRTVRLLSGEAAFEVVPDPQRPFVVEAGGGTTRALGTVFSVRRESDHVIVTGIEHDIRVSYPDDAAAAGSVATVVVHPGQSTTYGSANGLGNVATVRQGDDAWRRGKLVVEGWPLSQVVAELDRYHRGHIQLLGDVGETRVSGVFSVTDPIASLNIIDQSLGLKTTRLTDYLVIVSR